MKLSVVVSTYNGAHKLPVLLQALQQQTIQDFELLIIVDGSTDNTIEVLKEYQHSFDNFKIVAQKNQGRAGVRNNGAKLAAGNLLLFLDDDVEPLASCLEVHINHHGRSPSSLLSGAIIDRYIKGGGAFRKYKAYLSEKWCSHLLEMQQTPLKLDHIYLTAGNFSIGKEDFLKLGGFDKHLRDAEDFDLALRAYHMGYAIYYNHQAFAWHHDFPSCSSFIRRQRQYREYHQVLLKTKPALYDSLERFKVQKPSSMKQAFFSVWRNDWWVMAIDKNYFRFLPSRLQFRLYDWVITANTVYKNT